MKKHLGCFLLLLSFFMSCMATPACATEEPATVLVFGTTISAGEFHMSAVKTDGSLWVWGSNAYGALGVSELTQSTVPMKLIDHGVSSTIAGTSGLYGAIMQNGELWNWGISGNNGRLGRTTSEWIVNPGRAMEHVRQADSGNSHTLSLKEDGSLWVWGGNQYGELGNGMQGLRYESEWLNYNYEPLPVKTMTGIVSVEAGGNRSFAIDADGVLWAWGDNEGGELGFGRIGNETISFLKSNATRLCQTVPIRVMEQVKMVSALNNKTAIVKTDGSLWICGEAQIDWDDDAQRYHRNYEPVHVMDDVIYAAAGNDEFAAIKNDGSLWVWGDNHEGQLGVGIEIYEIETPQKIMEDVVSVTTGWSFMAALKKDGSLWAWGSNNYGQLGNGTTESSAVPIKVMDGVALPSPRKAGLQKDNAGLREDWLSARFFRDNAYILYNNMDFSWEEAADFCRNMGGHLATISSAEEQRFIEQMVSKRIFNQVWVGGSWSSFENWSWITGESWRYDHWNNDQLITAKGVGRYYLALGSNGEWLAEPANGPSHGLICEWEGGAQTSAVPVKSTCAIRFDPCFPDGEKGTLRSQMKTGVPGETYGTLPTPSLDKHFFEGWYTKKDGGKLITPSSIIEQKKDHTLYAHWTAVFDPPSVTDLSFAFSNSYNSFSYPNPYRIPLSQYQRIFGNNKTAQDLYDSYGEWTGSCHGMCMSSLLLYMDNEVDVSDFRYGAEKNGQLRLNDKNRTLGLSLLDLIECEHVSQMSARHLLEKIKHYGDYSGLVSAVLDFRKNGLDPILVSIRGPVRLDGTSSGHAVVAVGVWRDEKAKKDLLQIYDPNSPGDSQRYIDLLWDQPGHYTGWYYKMNDNQNWGTLYGSEDITYASYLTEFSIWCDRGSEIAYKSLIEMNSSEVSVYDYAGNLLATIHNGNLETKTRDIAAICTEDADTGNPKEYGISFWAPVGYYYLVNEDPNLETFQVSFTNGNDRVSILTDSSGILGCINEKNDRQMVYVDGLNHNYEITFRSSKEEIKVSGQTDKEVATCFCLQTGKLLSSAPDSAKEAISGGGEQKNIDLASVSDMISGEEPLTVSSLFQDVRGTDAILPAILWAWKNRVMAGIARGIFMPEKICTTEDVLTYLWRAAGCPGTGRDDASSPYEWAKATEIIDETVYLNDSCSLETFLTYIWRFLGEPGKNDAFGDYPDAWSWAEGTELLRLTPELQEPSAKCTRACVAVLLYHFFN